MSTCITTTVLDPRSVYPVFDLRRLAGTGPRTFGYLLALDAIQIGVEPTAGLSRCQMIVTLVSSLTETKEIQGVNLFSNTALSSVVSVPNGAPSMTVTRQGTGAQSCSGGVDTLVLCRHYAWPQGRTALYTFDPRDLWDFWGGCTVTFTWVRDNAGSGKWGDQTPPITYPSVPNGTLMFNASGTGFIVVFGDAAFPASTAFLNLMGIRLSTAVPNSVGRTLPADGTLLREVNTAPVYVVFGGAKFWIPDPVTLTLLGYHADRVGVIPPGGSAQLGTVPFDGTLIKELHDPKVHLVESGALRWVTSAAAMSSHCLSWRHVRTVPDGALTPFRRGPDLLP